MGDEIGRFHEVIAEERSAREESQSQMAKMIEDVHKRVNSELQKEINERRENEENLLRLLEETCLRVEKTVLGGN